VKIYSNSQSQSLQESFVLNVLEEKKGGTFLEIGGHDPISLSNTYLLEKDFGWKGFSLEIERKFSRKYNKQRSNPSICADATTFNYLDYLVQNNYPKVIDYLQVDIEPAYQTLSALLRVPIDKYQFRVITFEHDVYADPDNQRVLEVARTVLKSYGYLLVAGNVKNHGNPYEDWFVHPDLVRKEQYTPFISDSKEYLDIFTGAEIV
jgi:SAM-dependent methyltransferase